MATDATADIIAPSWFLSQISSKRCVFKGCAPGPDGIQIAGSRECLRCSESERECIRNSPLHFRPVKFVRLKAGNGHRVKHDLKFTPRQVWVELPADVRFLSPNLETESSREGEVVDEEVEEVEDVEEAPDPEAGVEAQKPFLEEQNQTSGAHNDWAVTNEATLSYTPLHSSLPHYSPESHLPATPLLPIGLLPVHSGLGASSHTHSSPALLDSAASITSPSHGLQSWPFRNQHEASLMHHYIVHLSLQFDSCDKQRHFGKEIPKRAAYVPVIKNAIFAVASRQMRLLAGAEDDQSHHYVSECLPILIRALEDPMGHFDENLLAAVILLRTHEEMSDNDERRHLFGTTRILNSIASFAADGGLREAASWVSLRQHIYISLTSQQPLTINLANYRHSSVFISSEDESWANRIIFTFATILTFLLRENGEQLSLEAWTELNAEVEQWEVSKPWHFAPFFHGGRKVSAPDENSSRWPELYVSNPAQVVGLQHYYLAKIILAIYHPRLAKLSIGSLRSRRDSESVVRENLRMVVGLAVSNDHVATAMYQASHILAACGMYLNDHAEQNAAVELLQRMTKRMGWQTSHIINDLREQWRV